MMMNCSRAAETDAPVCERAHAHVRRKARKFGGGYGRRKRGSNTRDGQGGARKRKSAMRL